MQRIVNKNDGSLIYEKDVETMKECVESAVFDGVVLLSARLSYENLVGAVLTTADFSHCDFFRGNCTSSDFSNSNLIEANFSQCNLFGVDFSGAELTNADLTRANLQGVVLTESQVDSLGVPLSDHQLSQVMIVVTD